MLPAALPALFARLTRRRRPTRRAQEPADLGTAFGMELRLDERVGTSPQAPAAVPARGRRSRR